MKLKELLFILALIFICTYPVSAHISPGDLSKSHTNLEGRKNCTKCHTVGSEVSSTKCLECHIEIKASIATKKGFHASAEVVSKECLVCHSEHHGRDFKIAKIDKKRFDHKKMGFELKGAHAKIDCRACHKPEFISNPKLKRKTSTYMGLGTACLSCHADYHQGKLSAECATCHNANSFKYAKVVGFDHNKTKFPLLGKHISVNCVACHKTETVNGKPAQRFKELKFESCTSCHKDVHDGKFGNDCKQCHSENSFHSINDINTFNHDKTSFTLQGKHKTVTCNLCHKTKSMTDPVKHDKCVSCHADYHKGEFVKTNVSPDCNECHINDGFSPSTFTIARHNKLNFKLEGAHLATPCMVCHRQQKDWSFAKKSTNCVECHENIHKGFISDKFMENGNCGICHNVKDWKSVIFDHDKTNFKLEGVHSRKSCSVCHFKENSSGKRVQQFEGLIKECSACHEDSHVGQFAENGKTECVRCHGFENWKELKFDHNTSQFKLDGAHTKVQCSECHKQTTNERSTFVKYKYKSIECLVCHL